MRDEDRGQHRQLEEVPEGDRGGADAGFFGDRADDRPAEHQAQGQQRGEHDHRQGDDELLRALLPDRALVGASVDQVGGTAEGADVAGGRPDRHREPEDEGDTGGAPLRGDRFDRSGEGFGRRARADFFDHFDHAAGRRLRVADQADDRDQGDQRGEEREQAVVGEGGRPVGQLILAERRNGLPEVLDHRPGDCDPTGCDSSSPPPTGAYSPPRRCLARPSPTASRRAALKWPGPQ